MDNETRKKFGLELDGLIKTANGKMETARGEVAAAEGCLAIIEKDNHLTKAEKDARRIPLLREIGKHKVEAIKQSDLIDAYVHKIYDLKEKNR